MAKVFCCGHQRTGTKSLGTLFEKNGHKVCSWKDSRDARFPRAAVLGDYTKITSHEVFATSTVFEDYPFFDAGFVKYLFHLSPDYYFVFVRRDPAAWFRSMVSHSAGRSLGNFLDHMMIYRRYVDLRFLLDHSSPVVIEKARFPIVDKQEHYIETYSRHCAEMEVFFRIVDPKGLRSIIVDAEDDGKFARIRDFFETKEIILTTLEFDYKHRTKADVGEIVSAHLKGGILGR